jgi:hypothetical protein
MDDFHRRERFQVTAGCLGEFVADFNARDMLETLLRDLFDLVADGAA